MNRKEFYNSLRGEVKEKIKACRSEEEMLAVLKEEQIELSPDLLESVSGGSQPIPLRNEENSGNKFKTGIIEKDRQDDSSWCD